MGNILPSDHFTNIDTICPSALRRRDHLDAPPLAALPPRFDIDDVRTCVRYIQSNKPWENHAGAPYWRVPESMHRRMRNNPHCATVDSDSSAKMGDMYGGGRRNSSAWRPCKTQRCAGSMKREARFSGGFETRRPRRQAENEAVGFGVGRNDIGLRLADLPFSQDDSFGASRNDIGLRPQLCIVYIYCGFEASRNDTGVRLVNCVRKSSPYKKMEGWEQRVQLLQA